MAPPHSHALLDQYLIPLPDYGLLICKSCQHAVWVDELARHLRGTHHSLPKAHVVEMIQVARSLPDLVSSHEELSLPDLVDHPFPHLTLHRDGLGCRHDFPRCRFICRTVKGMKSHLRERHGYALSSKKGRPSRSQQAEAASSPTSTWVSVVCQRFFPSRHGSAYFEVRHVGPEPRLEDGNSPSAAWRSIRSSMNHAFSRAQENSQSIITGGFSDEVSPWLERAKWASYLRGQLREDLLRLIAPPDPDREPVLHQLWRLMGDLIRHCHVTLRRRVGSYVCMEAVRTERHQTRYRPLIPYRSAEVLGQASRPWQAILMFLARTQLSPDLPAPRYKFTVAQKQAWERLHEALAFSPPPLNSEDGKSSADDGSFSLNIDSSSGILDGPSVACLQLAIALLNHRTPQDEYRSPLVCALAVLATQAAAWMPVDQYTSLLSAMIKVSRMMVIQHALQQAGEDNTTIESSSDQTSLVSEEDLPPDRSSCHDYVVKSMNTFMIRGTTTPIHWMLDLRAYGLTIAFETTSAGHIQWSGDRIYYKSLQFSMADFRAMVHGLINASRDLLLQKLLLLSSVEKPPSIPWSTLVDNPSNDQINWSFLQDPRNQLSFHDSEWFLDRIEKYPRLRSQFLVTVHPERWKHDAIHRYMRHVVDFRGKLLILMHITGGQPARAPEILSIRHRNTSDGQHRNIFVEDGLMVFVTRYHKGYSCSGSVKIIHRYLPREVGTLLLYYLWLVLPFVERLEHYLLHKKNLVSHLWPCDPSGREWKSERMRNRLKEESQIGLGCTLNLYSYRHLAIAISRRQLLGSLAFTPDEADEDGDEDEDDPHHILDAQAAHSSHVSGAVYARGIHELTGGITQVRERFRKASEMWHQFLRFESTFKRAVW